MRSDSDMASKVHFGDLHETSIGEMFNHYKELNTNEVRASVQNGLLLSGSINQLYSLEQRRKEVLKKFIHHTIDSVSSNYNYSDCGITAENGMLKLKYCPGMMTIITLNHIGIYSCSSIKSLTVYGPVIIKSQSCTEQILSKGDCQLAATQNFLDNDCHIVAKDSSNNKFLVGFIILLIIDLILIVCIPIFLVRMKKIKMSYNSKLTMTGMELYNYSRFDSEAGTTVSKERVESEDLITPNRKKLSWFKLLLILFCCRPIPANSYELVDSQVIDSNLYKYTLTMASSETINVGPKFIKLKDTDSISRLIHMFTSYDWEVEFENKYYCLQSGCNDKLTCRQDLLPFTREDKNYYIPIKQS